MAGDGKGEAGTASGRAGDKYGSTVKFGQFADDGKTQAEAGDIFIFLLTVGNVWLEDGRKERSGDTIPVIADADVDKIAVGMKIDGDVAATGRMLQCIDQ